eukprot:9338419-Ditylum_brightwellii.AAC.1
MEKRRLEFEEKQQKQLQAHSHAVEEKLQTQNMFLVEKLAAHQQSTAELFENLTTSIATIEANFKTILDSSMVNLQEQITILGCHEKLTSNMVESL